MEKNARDKKESKKWGKDNGNVQKWLELRRKRNKSGN
jgi:hypothetical protein